MKRNLKKLLASLAVSVAAFVCLCMPASAEPVSDSVTNIGGKVTDAGINAKDFTVGQKVTVNANGGLYLHNTISAASNTRIALMNRGSTVTIKEINTQFCWMKVEYVAPTQTYTGWCAGYDGYFTVSGTTINEYKYSGTYTAQVLKDNLPVYKNKEANVLNGDALKYGWVVKALAYTSNGYVKVRYYKNDNPDKTYDGYVSNTYLHIQKATENELPVDKKFTRVYGTGGRSKVSGLVVHSSLKFWCNDVKDLTHLAYGSEFYITSKSEHWYKIKFHYKGKVTRGYVWRDYVKAFDAMKENLSLDYTWKGFSYFGISEIDLYLKGEEGCNQAQLSVSDETYPTEMSKKITFSANNDNVKVTKKGKIKALKTGKTTITARVKVGNRTRKLKCKVYIHDTDPLYVPAASEQTPAAQ